MLQLKKTCYLVGNTNKKKKLVRHKSTRRSVNWTCTVHFVTDPQHVTEDHVMPAHLCLIWITSMTPVQMVTGCDHLISPVPIHLPVNSSIDTLCLLFFFSGKPHMIAAILNTPQRWKKWCDQKPPPSRLHPIRTFDPHVAVRGPDFMSLFWNLNVRLPSAHQLNRIYNRCQRQRWQTN